MERKRLELVIFSTLFIGLSVLIFFVFIPFISILVLSVVLSVIFNPLQKKLITIFPNGKNLVAFILVIIALIFFITPILFFGLQILGQAQSFFSLTQASQTQYIHVIEQNINTLVQHFVPNFSFNIVDAMSKVVDFVSLNLGGLISQTAYIFFQLLFLLFASFFFLRDGDKMLESLVSLSPFEKEQNKEIISSVYLTITSFIRGTIFVGLIRFALLATAFYCFGIPNALFWASIGGIVSMVPGFGTPFAVIPAFIYLLLYGNIFWAFGMVLFGILLVFFIDNALSAYFFGKGLNVSPIFVLLSIIGGIISFGPLGFIFGPIILSLFISSIDIYKILVLKKS